MAKRDEMKSISLSNGKFNFLMNKTFGKSKIDKYLVPDIKLAISTIKNENVDFDESSDIYGILIMCILKNFTNLGLDNLDLSVESDVRKLIAVQAEFYKNNIFEEIISNIDPIEFKKLKRQLKSYMLTMESDDIGNNRLKSIYESTSGSDTKKG